MRMKKNSLKVVLSVVFLSFMVSCGQQQSEVSDLSTEETENTDENIVQDPNSSPESAVNTIFQAAKSGEVGVLKFLLPPYDENGEMPCDGDCKALCNPGNESMKDELRNNYIPLNDFKSYFANGKIVGSPSISGNEASVNFVFGPNLENNETMNLQEIEGKWYLKSF